MKCKIYDCDNEAFRLGCCKKHYIPKKSYKGNKKDYIKPKCFCDYTECMAYCLGILYSDGYLIKPKDGRQSQLGLKMNDKEVVDIVAKYIGVAQFVGETLRKDVGSTFYSFRLSCQELCDRLNYLGLTFDKSYNQRIPKIPLHLMPHFIRGLLDGDGHIASIEQPRVSLLVTGDLALYINNLLYNYGFDTDLQAISTKSGYELYGLSLNISNHNSVKFLDWIYKDAHYYLSRKYEQYIAISNKTYKYPKYSRRRVHEYGDVFYDSIKDDDIV